MPAQAVSGEPLGAVTWVTSRPWMASAPTWQPPEVFVSLRQRADPQRAVPGQFAVTDRGRALVPPSSHTRLWGFPALGGRPSRVRSLRRVVAGDGFRGDFCLCSGGCPRGGAVLLVRPGGATLPRLDSERRALPGLSAEVGYDAPSDYRRFNGAGQHGRACAVGWGRSAGGAG